MQRYLGLDVHAASCTFVVVSATGRQLRRDVVETNGQALVGYLKQQPGRLHLCLEESEWAAWLYEILTPHVAEVVVVHGEKRRGPKNDALDARALAERLRTGQIQQSIFKAPRKYAKLRELASVYGLLTGDVVQAKNRLRSRFRRRAVLCKGSEIYHPERRQEKLRLLPPAFRPAIELLGAELDAVEQLKAQAEAVMVEESHRHKISRILETLPGLGRIRVAQMIPIVVTPFRFRTKRQFWAYCGFAVVTRSSADWVQVNGKWVKDRGAQTRGLNTRRNRTLKMIFKGAATTVIAHAKPNAFREAYDRLCSQGTKPNLAKLTVARKLAATTLAMWKTQEVYDPKR